MENIVKRYRYNGIGFDCDTSELKDLNEEFKRPCEERLESLTFYENKRKELQDGLAEIGKEGLDALNIVKKDLFDKQLKEIDKEINLLILSLSYKNMSEFIGFKLGKEISIVYQINQ